MSTLIGNNAGRFQSLYLYTGTDCNSNNIVENNKQGFAAFKKSMLAYSTDAISYCSPNSFGVSFNQLAVNNINHQSEFLPYRSPSMPLTKGIELHAGDSLSFNWNAYVNQGGNIRIRIVSEHDTVFLVKVTSAIESERIVWVAPHTDTYTLLIDMPISVVHPSTCYINTKVTAPEITVRLDPAAAIMSNEDLLSVSPNPFTNSTSVSYRAVGDMSIRLDLYNEAGQLMRTLDEGNRVAGLHTITFSSDALSAGNYFVALTSGGHSTVRKIVIKK